VSAAHPTSRLIGLAFLVAAVVSAGAPQAAEPPGRGVRASPPQRATPGSAVNVSEAIARLRDPDPSVREAAVRALAGLRPGQYASVTPQDIATLAEILKVTDPALGSPGPTDLTTPGPWVRQAAARAFADLTHTARGAELSRAAVGVISRALQDPEPGIAVSAATALGHIRDESSRPALIAALADPRPGVVAASAAAIGHLTTAQNAAQLVPALRQESARKPIAGVLGRLGPEAPYGELAAALTSPDVELRRGAAYALGRLGDPRCRDPLVRALGDPDAGVRQMAASGLVLVGDDRATPALVKLLDDPDPRVRPAAASALRNGGSAAVDPLVARLNDPDPQMRREAKIALGLTRDPRAVQPLLDLLRQPVPDLELSEILGHWKGNKDLIRGLISMLTSPDQLVRNKVAWALTVDNGKIAILGREAVPPMVAALKNPDVEVRRVAAMTMRTLAVAGALEPGDVAPLREAAQDPDQRVGQFATSALARLDGRQRGGSAPAR
jgi:HEAT repeat protein